MLNVISNSLTGALNLNTSISIVKNFPTKVTLYSSMYVVVNKVTKYWTPNRSHFGFWKRLIWLSSQMTTHIISIWQENKGVPGYSPYWCLGHNLKIQKVHSVNRNSQSTTSEINCEKGRFFENSTPENGTAIILG